jgi:hypothetical protein
LYGFLCGFGLVLTVPAFGFVFTDTGPEHNIIVNTIATLFKAAFIGGTPGLMLGVVVGLAREVLPRPAAPRPLHVPTRPSDQWSMVVARCEQSVQRVAAAVATVPASPAKDWMLRISGQFHAELNDVRGIAELGRALGAVDENHPVSQRLLAAARDFATFEAEVGRVALKMFDKPELDRARTDLEFLEQQLPSLGS